jgi:hypothetical protein
MNLFVDIAEQLHNKGIHDKGHVLFVGRGMSGDEGIAGLERQAERNMWLACLQKLRPGESSWPRLFFLPLLRALMPDMCRKIWKWWYHLENLALSSTWSIEGWFVLGTK